MASGLVVALHTGECVVYLVRCSCKHCTEQGFNVKLYSVCT